MHVPWIKVAWDSKESSKILNKNKTESIVDICLGKKRFQKSSTSCDPAKMQSLYPTCRRFKQWAPVIAGLASHACHPRLTDKGAIGMRLAEQRKKRSPGETLFLGRQQQMYAGMTRAYIRLWNKLTPQIAHLCSSGKRYRLSLHTDPAQRQFGGWKLQNDKLPTWLMNQETTLGHVRFLLRHTTYMCNAPYSQQVRMFLSQSSLQAQFTDNDTHTYSKLGSRFRRKTLYLI